MQCRNSPFAESPTPNLPKIPGVASPEKDTHAKEESKENGHEPTKAYKKAGGRGMFIENFYQCGTYSNCKN